MNFKFNQDLTTDVLGAGAVGEYDGIILDARLNQTWLHSQDSTQRNRGDYVRDAVMNDFENKIGNIGPHSRQVHVYLNGLYWGLYTLHEKPEHHFASAYFGGDSDDYDVVKQGQSDPNFLVAGLRINPAVAISNSNFTAGVSYAQLLSLAAADLSVQANYDALAAKLDIPHFIRYILLNIYGANDDWAQHNWYASMNRVDPTGKWRFHSWDAEHVFKDVNANSSRNATNKSATSDGAGSRGPTYIHQHLAGLLSGEWTDSSTSPAVLGSPTYRRLFADIAQQMLYNGGPFTPAASRDLWDTRLLSINEAIRGESARWGDSGPSTSTTTSPELHLRSSDVVSGSTTFVSWWNERLRILNTIVNSATAGAPNRTTVTIAQLQARNLFPTLLAPVFSQQGGTVPANYSLTITNPGGAGTIYVTQDGTDPRTATDTVSSSAKPYAGAISLTTSRTVRARVFSNSTWSALNDAYFSVGLVPAAAGNLVITKINYKPGAVTTAEAAAGYSDRGDFEFVEVMNISQNRVNLDGLSFTAGITVAALAGGVRELAPGERALYVSKLAAFQFRYGSGLPIAGTFTDASNLKNEGETVTLVGATGTTIVSVTYDDASPWPAQANGTGNSLVLMNPATNDPNVGTNWRASTQANGAPGVDDRSLWASWQAARFSSADAGYPASAAPAADFDGDGLSNLYEFFLGTNPKVATPSSVLPTASTLVLDAGNGPQTFPALTLRRQKAAEELTWAVEATSNLTTWGTNVTQVGAATDNGDGSETRTYRANQPLSTTPVFFHVKVTLP